jgi:hypothetical protein
LVSDSQGYGKVDWSKMVIITAGIGVPNPGLPPAAQKNAALGAAQQMAVQKAYETIGSLYFNTTSRVSDILVTGNSVADSLKQVLSAFETQASIRELKNGSIEAMVEIPFFGAGSPMDFLLERCLTPASTAGAPESQKTGTGPLFSGLVVDCRALGLKPAIAPRILDEKGKEIFGMGTISHEWARRFGMAGYARSVEEALKQADRVGSGPLQLKAKRAGGKNATDAVISDIDAATISTPGRNRQVLSECRVILVVD